MNHKQKIFICSIAFLMICFPSLLILPIVTMFLLFVIVVIGGVAMVAGDVVGEFYEWLGQ